MAKDRYLGSLATIALVGTTACNTGNGGGSSLAPANMPRIGTVDERLQSFNVEMVEVTGGRFWKPYKDVEAILKGQPSPKEGGAVPAGWIRACTSSDPRSI